MRWPWTWTRPRPTAREISDMQEMRLRNAREAAVQQERERILRGLEKIQRWSDDGEVVVPVQALRSLIQKSV